MFLPPQYFWLEPVLIAAVVVFVVDLISNNLTFSSRTVNAFVTALIFAIIFGVLAYYGYGSVQVTFNTTPSVTAPAH
jgi:lysylphosphatidylglycerol synthetase-like protein (DUF2156 family)